MRRASRPGSPTRSDGSLARNQAVATRRLSSSLGGSYLPLGLLADPVAVAVKVMRIRVGDVPAHGEVAVGDVAAVEVRRWRRDANGRVRRGTLAAGRRPRPVVEAPRLAGSASARARRTVEQLESELTWRSKQHPHGPRRAASVSASAQPSSRHLGISGGGRPQTSPNRGCCHQRSTNLALTGAAVPTGRLACLRRERRSAWARRLRR